MVVVLRDFRIADGRLPEFIDAWRRGVVPLRRAFGFRVAGAWTIEHESRFVWLVSLDGDWGAFDAATSAYYGSAQRAALDPDPAQWITEAREHRLIPVSEIGDTQSEET